MIKANKLLIFIIMVILSLAGCTTLSKHECLNADWYSIGFQDGYKGYSKSRFSKHQQACAEFRVTPILRPYLEGYDKGNFEFCDPENGYHRGVNGYAFKNVCLGSSSAAYHAAYLEGKNIYSLKKKILSEHSLIKEKEDKLDDLERQKEIIESQLINNKLTTNERRLLIEKIHLIEQNMRFNKDSIYEHKRIISNLDHELEGLVH